MVKNTYGLKRVTGGLLLYYSPVTEHEYVITSEGKYMRRKPLSFSGGYINSPKVDSFVEFLDRLVPDQDKKGVMEARQIQIGHMKAELDERLGWSGKESFNYWVGLEAWINERGTLNEDYLIEGSKELLVTTFQSSDKEAVVNVRKSYIKKANKVTKQQNKETAIINGEDFTITYVMTKEGDIYTITEYVHFHNLK